jgi:hypothetical protein
MLFITFIMKILVTFAIFIITYSLAILPTGFIGGNIILAQPTVCNGNSHGVSCKMVDNPKESSAEWLPVHNTEVIN